MKRLRGNPGCRPLGVPRATILAANTPPRAPRGLGKVGKSAWTRLWTHGRVWLSPETDYALLARLCEAYDEREAIRSEMAKLVEQIGFIRTYLIRGSTGQEVLNPLVPALRSLEAQILRMESLCGFTPTDRSRIGAVEVEVESKLDSLLARRSRRAPAADAIDADPAD